MIGSRLTRLFGPAAAAAGLVLALCVPASADAVYLKGFGDPKFTSGPAERDSSFDQAASAGANIARLNLSWRRTATGQPANPSSPSDPAYDFSAIDAAVSDAVTRGMRVMITIYEAPEWAEANNQPPADALHPEGTFRPHPEMLGQFAEAVATRFSGGFSPSPLAPPLPEVGYFEGWNEPNLSVFLNPQWTGRNNQAAQNYRRMINGFYDGVKRANPDAEVVTAGLAPFGGKLDPKDPPTRTRPLRFLREFLCLHKNRDLKPDKCKQPPRFDILAHHPINVNGGPRKSATHPDDASGAIDMRDVEKTLRYAEKKNTIGGGKHGIWATEFWWQTNPPDKDFGYKLSQQSRYIAETFYLLDKYGVNAALMLQVIDDPYQQQNNNLQTGVYFIDGSRKPAFTAFRFPFVLDRTSKKKVAVWTIPPASGQVLIEEKTGSGFKTIASGNGQTGEVLKDTLKLKGSVTLRASVGGESSQSWTEKKSGQGRSGGGGEAAPAQPEATPPPGLVPLPEAPPIPDPLAPYLEAAPGA